ncbi:MULTISPECIES: hypothetical protein [Haloferax]|uniref:Uncharacterized protein n=1 Tax=Haloferax marinum TaxID=2666143 RepID=A0A6A8G7L6_9EURY|nr:MULTISPECIES: hypothetical protein [Haloferax]KAB1197790.1 hypothetical protein Hfx1150_09735 [Haloferax sp. CBA1150]MRW96847.1 hypothetical protein [Haloferax marinum]
MRDLIAILSEIRLGEETSLIVKPPNRPDDRDDVDATLIQATPPYLFDDGELVYQIVEDDDRYEVLASNDETGSSRTLGELRAVVNMSA